MTSREIEVAMSVMFAEWSAEQNPDEDVETTRLEEVGIDERGILLTIGDQEFQITVVQVN